jgi:hypothetical protein
VRNALRVATVAAALAIVFPIVGVDAGSPQPVEIIVQTTLATPSHGPFTASGPAVDSAAVCANGRTMDVSLVSTPDPLEAGATDFDIYKAFVCGADGTYDTGSFTLRLQVHTDSAGNDTYTWTVVGGTGPYSRMTGSGTGYGLTVAYGIEDHFSGAFLLAGGSTPVVTTYRMAGRWATTDCAQYRKKVNGTHAYDCTRWGDNSPQALSIASGAVPKVQLIDAYAKLCVRAGRPARFTANGYGQYLSSNRLRVTFTEQRCGTIKVSMLASIIVTLTSATTTRDDELWWDSDAPATPDWGYIFYRGTSF